MSLVIPVKHEVAGYRFALSNKLTKKEIAKLKDKETVGLQFDEPILGLMNEGIFKFDDVVLMEAEKRLEIRFVEGVNFKEEEHEPRQLFLKIKKAKKTNEKIQTDNIEDARTDEGTGGSINENIL